MAIDFNEKDLQYELERIEKESERIRENTNKIRKMKTNDIEHEKALIEIKKEIVDFDEEDLLRFTKNAIVNIHYFFSHEKYNQLKNYCSEELIKKILDDKKKYRIDINMDNIRVGFAKIRDVYKKDDFFIKVHTSVFFYDDARNNNAMGSTSDKYWNDIWTITYKRKKDEEITNKCPNCGSLMEYNIGSKTFLCDYCRNTFMKEQMIWEIYDISVNE